MKCVKLWWVTPNFVLVNLCITADFLGTLDSAMARKGGRWVKYATTYFLEPT